jgi:hypothetical protein
MVEQNGHPVLRVFAGKSILVVAIPSSTPTCPTRTPKQLEAITLRDAFPQLLANMH